MRASWDVVEQLAREIAFGSVTRCPTWGPCNLRDVEVKMIWFLVLLLLLLAVGGGIFVTKFLFIVLLFALLLALFGRSTTTQLTNNPFSHGLMRMATRE
jgi:hypothetical protein